MCKVLIPANEFGIFVDTNDVARISSLSVAEFFKKRHANVIRDIEKLTDSKSGLSREFNQLNFESVKYKDNKGEKRKAYNMTRDGFTMLVMGYTGEKAMQFKELYIKRFNEMESVIKSLVMARQEFPLLTDIYRRKRSRFKSLRQKRR